MEFFENSIFLRHLNKMSKVYWYIEERISFIYLSSFSYQLTKGITAELIKIVKSSFLGRLARIDFYVLQDFFETSKIRKVILNWAQEPYRKLVDFSVASSAFIFIKGLKFNFLLQPIKVGGAIVILTIMINSILSFLLQKHITLWGWVIRGIFLFIGINGLFCHSGWQDLKKTSFILRRLNL